MRIFLIRNVGYLSLIITIIFIKNNTLSVNQTTSTPKNFVKPSYLDQFEPTDTKIKFNYKILKSKKRINDNDMPKASKTNTTHLGGFRLNYSKPSSQMANYTSIRGQKWHKKLYSGEKFSHQLRNPSMRKTFREHRDKVKKIPFVITLCKKVGGKGKGKVTKNIFFRQAMVLLKSMALVSEEAVRIIVISNAPSTFEHIKNQIRSWPLAFIRKLDLEFRTFRIQSYCLDEKLFPPCATVRMFLHEILFDEEQIVYVDTDFIFLEPPQKIFQNFESFNQNHLIGAAPNRGFYERQELLKADYFFYGENGLCTGILLMNLSGIRTFEYNWTSTVDNICRAYKRRLTLYDQGVFNILFSEFPDMIYDLDCRWNYNVYYCHNKTSCPQAELSESIFAVHGTSNSFFLDIIKHIKRLYQAFEDFNLKESVKSLIEKVLMKINEIEKNQPKDTDGCQKVKRLTKALTSGLIKALEREAAASY